MKYMIKKSEWHLMTDADHGFGGQEEQAAHIASHSKFFYLLNISELSFLKNVTANDLETSYILFLSQLCNIQRTL